MWQFYIDFGVIQMATEKSRNITLRLREEEIDALNAYAEAEGIARTQAVRIGLMRLFKKKPTAHELESTERKIGNPIMLESGTEASKLGERGANARHQRDKAGLDELQRLSEELDLP